MRDGILMRRFEAVDGRSERWQTVLPTEMREEFLRIAHSGMTGGHLGRDKTAAVIQSRAYWPTWASNLDRFMRQCKPCARYHRGGAPRQTKLQPLVVGEPWERVSVEITGPHPRSSRQNQYILTLVDHFSKWAEAIPPSNHTTPTVAKAPMVHVFTKFGAPRQLLTDRGPEFESLLFAELMRWMEIDKIRTTAYKPSTNGAVERFHRTLNSMLGKVVKDSQRDWDDRLPYVMAAYRASVHESTGYTPNQLFMGRDLRMPLDLVMGLPADECTSGRTVDEVVDRMKERATECYVAAREHLRVAAERRKTTYDIRVRIAEFTVGDWVWYLYPRRYRSRSPKWQKNYTGPYLITRVIEPVNYVLQKTARSKPFVVHADKLKRCYGVTPRSWIPAAVTVPVTGGQSGSDDALQHLNGSNALDATPEVGTMLQVGFPVIANSERSTEQTGGGDESRTVSVNGPVQRTTAQDSEADVEETAVKQPVVVCNSPLLCPLETGGQCLQDGHVDDSTDESDADGYTTAHDDNGEVHLRDRTRRAPRHLEDYVC